MKKTVCVVSGSRAEYGLLKNLLQCIQLSKNLNLELVITGSHISKKYGLTLEEIISDGFQNFHTVDMQLGDDTSKGITKSMGLGLIEFADLFNKLSPDLIAIVGDRYETFVAATAAMVGRIPIAHIHGGELTEGAIDDVIRHAITKFSHLHFVATNEYRNRVIQLGENPKYVYCVGGLGVDAIQGLSLLSRYEIEAELRLKLKKYNFLITYHPETLGKISPEKQIYELLLALENFRDVNLIFTAPNADMGGNTIKKAIDEFVKKNSNAYFFQSLGQKKYISCLAHFDVVIGNSSSGLLEAPSFKIATVNVGERQKGRIAAKSVINCQCNSESIKDAINKSLSLEFRKKIKFIRNPYEKKGSAKKIVEIIENLDVKTIHIKSFYDIK
jgi:GDP/UDP-N,N'-diacetylbacillosamine 2-epimerase (hydrolysing)